MQRFAVWVPVPWERPARASFYPRAYEVGLSPRLLRVGSEWLLSSRICPVMLVVLSVVSLEVAREADPPFIGFAFLVLGSFNLVFPGRHVPM